MNWGQFKEAVRTYLLVDAQRKGRGVQKYINQLMRSAIIDLQRYVPELRATTIESYRSHDTVTDWSSTKQYAFGDIVTKRNLSINSKYGAQSYQAVRGDDNAVTQPPLGSDPETSKYWVKANILAPTEEGAHEGSFDKQFSMVDRVYIRQFPLSGTNTLDKSMYHPVRQIDWDDRALLLDGKTPYRTISFGDDGFIYAPQLAKDEKLLIEWRGEKHFDTPDYFEVEYPVTIANSPMGFNPPYTAVGASGTETIIECSALEKTLPAGTTLTFENGGQFIVGDVGFVAADGQPAGPYNGKGDVAITGRIIYLPSGGQISLGEKTISPRDAEEVVFDEREAKAVAEYIKAHLQREVDKDLNMYKSHSTQYQKERQEIYRERREYKPTSLTNPYPVSTATVGPYQVN